MKLRVLTALEPHHEATAVARIGQLSELELVRRCPDLPDLIAASAAGLADLAVISGGLPGLDRDALGQVREHGVLVVGLVGPAEDAERRMRQLGVTATIPADCGAEELERAIALLQRPAGEHLPDEMAWAAVEAGLDPVQAPPAGNGPRAGRAAGHPLAGSPEPQSAEAGQEPGRGRIVAIWGPTGSPGRTTLAANLAAELALAGCVVLLVDADTYGAAIGQYLGLLDEAPGLAAAARAAEVGTLDLPVLARLAPSVEPGFRVLTGLPSAGRWPEVRADSLGHILDLARGLADVTIVDVGFCLEDDEDLSYDTRAPRRNAATLTALARADEIIAVGAGDPVGLQRLVRGLAELGSAIGHTPTVVVNKVRSSAAGMSPERTISETLERFAGIAVDHAVPEDRAAFDKALLAGRLLHEVAPKSAARSRIRTLAAALRSQPVADAAAAPGRFTLRRGLGRGMGRTSTA